VALLLLLADLGLGHTVDEERKGRPARCRGPCVGVTLVKPLRTRAWVHNEGLPAQPAAAREKKGVAVTSDKVSVLCGSRMDLKVLIMFIPLVHKGCMALLQHAYVAVQTMQPQNGQARCGRLTVSGPSGEAVAHCARTCVASMCELSCRNLYVCHVNKHVVVGNGACNVMSRG
jgi:hypothetical protein